MKTLFQMIPLSFFLLNISLAHAGFGANGMEVDRESLGLGGYRMISFEPSLDPNGLRSLNIGANGLELPKENSILKERSFNMNEYSREIGAGGF